MYAPIKGSLVERQHLPSLEVQYRDSWSCFNNSALTWDWLQGLVRTVRAKLTTERSVQRKSLFLLCRTSLVRLLCSPGTKQDCYPLFTERCSLQTRAEHVVSCSWHSKWPCASRAPDSWRHTHNLYCPNVVRSHKSTRLCRMNTKDHISIIVLSYMGSSPESCHPSGLRYLKGLGHLASINVCHRLRPGSNWLVTGAAWMWMETLLRVWV